jgi:glycosyltransferase involved in cell wall biosynthesis
MKIVYVVQEFPPGPIRGTGIAVFQVAKDMVARGHKVWVLAPQLWPSDECSSIGFFDEKVDGLSVRRLVFNPDLSPNPILYEYYNPILSVYAKDFLRQISPDIIHIYHLLRLSSSIIDAAKELKIPVILTLMDFWFLCPSWKRFKSDGSLCGDNPSWKDCIYCLKENDSIYDRITKVLDETKMKFYVQKLGSNNKFKFSLMNNRQVSSLLLAAAGRLPFLKSQLEKVGQIVCHSSFLSKVFLKKGYFHNSFRVVSPGIIYPAKLPSRKGQISNITFGYFGGGKKFKGAHILLEAFRAIKSSNVNLKLYGDFPSTQYVNELYRIADGDERIDFMGNFERTELTKALSGIDILVMPSIWYENCPMSILEAFANKVPVIATDIGGIPEIVHDNLNGLLFKRGDVLDLKQKMGRVINELGLIQRFRENIPRVKSMNEECDELLGIYENLLLEK